MAARCAERSGSGLSLQPQAMVGMRGRLPLVQRTSWPGWQPRRWAAAGHSEGCLDPGAGAGLTQALRDRSAGSPASASPHDVPLVLRIRAACSGPDDPQHRPRAPFLVPSPPISTALRAFYHLAFSVTLSSALWIKKLRLREAAPFAGPHSNTVDGPGLPFSPAPRPWPTASESQTLKSRCERDPPGKLGPVWMEGRPARGPTPRPAGGGVPQGRRAFGQGLTSSRTRGGWPLT